MVGERQELLLSARRLFGALLHGLQHADHIVRAVRSAAMCRVGRRSSSGVRSSWGISSLGPSVRCPLQLAA